MESNRDRLVRTDRALVRALGERDHYRDAFLIVAEQLEAAADKFTELSLPVYELACRGALVEATEAAAFDPTYNATVAPIAPQERDA